MSHISEVKNSGSNVLRPSADQRSHRSSATHPTGQQITSAASQACAQYLCRPWPRPVPCAHALTFSLSSPQKTLLLGIPFIDAPRQTANAAGARARVLTRDRRTRSAVSVVHGPEGGGIFRLIHGVDDPPLRCVNVVLVCHPTWGLDRKTLVGDVVSLILQPVIELRTCGEEWRGVMLTALSYPSSSATPYQQALKHHKPFHQIAKQPVFRICLNPINIAGTWAERTTTSPMTSTLRTTGQKAPRSVGDNIPGRHDTV